MGISFFVNFAHPSADPLGGHLCFSMLSLNNISKQNLTEMILKLCLQIKSSVTLVLFIYFFIVLNKILISFDLLAFAILLVFKFYFNISFIPVSNFRTYVL